jgi:acyl-coenzyme A synthetase/AMP-(fatty) acid ligase
MGGELLNTRKYSLDEGQVVANQGLPYLGFDFRILDEQGREITEPNVEGYHVIKLPGPLTMLSCFWENDFETMKEKYYSRFPGYFFNGDMGCMDENRCYKHSRRIDDYIRLGYKKSSVSYVNSVMNSFPGVENSMIIANLDSSKWYTYIVTQPNNRNNSFQDNFKQFVLN